MSGPPPVPALVVRDTGNVLTPDPGRVVLRFFVPGQEDVGPGDSRAAPVVERILQLEDEEVDSAMADVDDRFADRHRELHESFERHAALVAHRLDPATVLTPSRLRLLGASFSHEYAIEGAALCNPSMVLHPEQPTGGDTAFVLSVRGIGEGHRSSIGFRTGTITASGEVSVDPPGPFPHLAAAGAGTHHRSVLHRKLAELGDDHENAAYVLDPLPESFSDAELGVRVDALLADAVTRRNTGSTIVNLERLARSSYRVEFPPSSALSERVLWPQTAAESQGMEDARFVRFADEGAAPTYYGTYTAFDGHGCAQHLLATDDFVSFGASPMAGAAATGKGLALFPRRVNGRFAALSRFDRETNWIAFSDDLRCWDTAVSIQTPVRAWEILQLGNCGSPIETEAGWLVLTHGVGPMRTYALGALLLDLDRPEIVLAHSEAPILSPGAETRGGYVPNVVYSCGALARGDLLVLPYGVGDRSIAIATMSIDGLLGSLRAVSAPTRRS
jgi:predicted GH43/DUF377 family glycosyl hydrolase